jgi:hypothetical protein
VKPTSPAFTEIVIAATHKYNKSDVSKIHKKVEVQTAANSTMNQAATPKRQPGYFVYSYFL